MIIGALVGAAIGAGVSIATQMASGHSINWGEVGTQAAVGALSGAISGLAGPEAGLAVHALIGAASGMAGQLVNNAMTHKPLGDGVLMAGLIGGATVGLGEGVGGPLLSKLLGKAAGEAAGVAEDAARGATKEAGEEVEGAVACALSFAPSTPVATPSGEKSIASLKVGDKVTAYDPKTGKTTTQTVQHVWINHDTDLIDLTLRTDDAAAARAPVDLRRARAALVGETYGRAPPAGAGASAKASGYARDEMVHTTAKHPFLTVAGGWMPAGRLAAGMRLVREDGAPATVVGMRVVPGAADMWNLTVSQLHTYAVGVGEYVVHNCGGGGTGTVWDRIRPTGGEYPKTGLPTEFELQAGGRTFRVLGRVTEHMQEYLFAGITKGFKAGLARTLPAAGIDMMKQMMLASFAGAVDDALENIPDGVVRNDGLRHAGWELAIDTLNNVIYHGRPPV